MTIKFEKIKPGMTLYDVRKATGWDAARSKKWVHYTVSILAVDLDNRMALASWNNFLPRWFHESNITKYRAKLPKDK